MAFYNANSNPFFFFFIYYDFDPSVPKGATYSL